MADNAQQDGQEPALWPVPDSARITDGLLREWGEVRRALDSPPVTHRRGLGAWAAWGKSQIQAVISPVIGPPLELQAAWNSEVLRRVVELEGRIAKLEQQLALKEITPDEGVP